MDRDLYAVLGVPRGASAEEIKRAYRSLARTLHPDANPGDPDAEARFKEVALAYETLGDPDRRRRYDMFGTVGSSAGSASGGPFGADLGDLLGMFFGNDPFSGRGSGGPPRGMDLEAVVDIGFEQAVFGAQVPVTVRTAVVCEECEATGAAPGTSASTCPDCAGTGQVRQVRQSILGQMVTAGQCRRCSGLGKVVTAPCSACRGEGRTVTERTYTVEVPAGIDTGSTLRLTGRGAVGPRGGAAGDLYVHLRVGPHDRFRRDGFDLHHELHVTVTQAALGATVHLSTLDGDEELVLPRGTQTGRVFRLRGRGVPHVEGRGRGDLLVEVVVDTPVDLDEQDEELLRQFAERRGEDVAPADQGFIARIRSAFS